MIREPLFSELVVFVVGFIFAREREERERERERVAAG